MSFILSIFPSVTDYCLLLPAWLERGRTNVRTNCLRLPGPLQGRGNPWLRKTGLLLIKAWVCFPTQPTPERSLLLWAMPSSANIFYFILFFCPRALWRFCPCLFVCLETRSCVVQDGFETHFCSQGWPQTPDPHNLGSTQIIGVHHHTWTTFPPDLDKIKVKQVEGEKINRKRKWEIFLSTPWWVHSIIFVHFLLFLK